MNLTVNIDPVIAQPDYGDGGEHVLASPKHPVAKFKDGFLKLKWIERLEHDQKIASCCRHPENHEVSAWKSKASEPVPDVYIFHCTCGRKHRFFCVGGGDERPAWTVR